MRDRQRQKKRDGEEKTNEDRDFSSREQKWVLLLSISAFSNSVQRSQCYLEDKKEKIPTLIYLALFLLVLCLCIFFNVEL